MAGAGPTVGGGSISSKPASADRPYFHSGIFFSPSKIFGMTHAAYSRVAHFVPNKAIALSNA
jgi:hypothetical protein